LSKTRDREEISKIIREIPDKKSGKSMKRILVIDDEMHIRQMLRQTLERAGFEVVDAPDGKEGLRLYHEFPADLVIIDIIMPVKEGVETIFELRRDFPDVKIIAISGGGFNINSQRCLSYVKTLGVSHRLTKPFHRNELLEAIQELLGNVLIS
jgi:CheY-like chemotaxis protein